MSRRRIKESWAKLKRWWQNPFAWLQGFKPRDTDIGRKLIVWRNIESHTGYKKTLSLSPYAKKKRYVSWFGEIDKDAGCKDTDSMLQDTYVSYKMHALFKSKQGTAEFQVCLPAADFPFWTAGIRLWAISTFTAQTTFKRLQRRLSTSA